MKIPKFKSLDKKCKNCLEEGYKIGYGECIAEVLKAIDELAVGKDKELILAEELKTYLEKI
jgi:hypothetical protein